MLLGSPFSGPGSGAVLAGRFGVPVRPVRVGPPPPGRSPVARALAPAVDARIFSSEKSRRPPPGPGVGPPAHPRGLPFPLGGSGRSLPGPGGGARFALRSFPASPPGPGARPPLPWAFPLFFFLGPGPQVHLPTLARRAPRHRRPGRSARSSLAPSRLPRPSAPAARDCAQLPKPPAPLGVGSNLATSRLPRPSAPADRDRARLSLSSAPFGVDGPGGPPSGARCCPRRPSSLAAPATQAAPSRPPRPSAPAVRVRARLSHPTRPSAPAGELARSCPGVQVSFLPGAPLRKFGALFGPACGPPGPRALPRSVERARANRAFERDRPLRDGPLVHRRILAMRAAQFSFLGDPEETFKPPSESFVPPRPRGESPGPPVCFGRPAGGTKCSRKVSSLSGTVAKARCPGPASAGR